MAWMIGSFLFACGYLAITVFGGGELVVTGPLLEADNPSLLQQHGRLLQDGTPLTGVVIERHPNGRLRSRIPYLQGLRHGEWRSWHLSGGLKTLRPYRHGEKVGRHQGFWEDRSPRFQVGFVNGRYHGSYRSWHRNGDPHQLMQYVHGEKDGLQKTWAADGTLLANYEVRNGRRYGLVGARPCFTVKEDWS